ncbi:MAG TPA: hypothetical protein VI248_14245 [Kineosporiaceae bacterium]
MTATGVLGVEDTELWSLLREVGEAVDEVAVRVRAERGRCRAGTPGGRGRRPATRPDADTAAGPAQPNRSSTVLRPVAIGVRTCRACLLRACVDGRHDWGVRLRPSVIHI